MTDDQGRSRSTESPEAEPAVKPEGDAGKKRDKKGPKKERLRDRLKTAEAKAEENYERVLRVTADFENYKKRVEREMNDFRKFANESLVKEMLPIVDNLERAICTGKKGNEDALEALRQGVEMTLKGLMDGLKKFGVVPVDALKKPFDPNFHQAVSQEETERFPENTVCQELQKGYMLQDRLLRPAMVVVSRKPDTGVDVKSRSPEDGPEAETVAH
ncbi:MAG: nucleotide exchange factor GrpE [Thermodesulfobacteriota bacterium]|nr:nucleotide exchange factor GrpE [Thermodesulfobacteriota bacterium]